MGPKVISQQTLEAGILIAFGISVLTFAGFMETNATVASESGEITNVSVPFPGRKWLDIMGIDKSNEISVNGETYSSAYSAFLYGDHTSSPSRNVSIWINSWLFGPKFVAKVIDAVGIEWGHYLLTYARDFVAATLVYYVTASIFHYFIYIHPQSKRIFKNRTRPTWDTMTHQMKVAQKSIFVYTLFPLLDEMVVHSGISKAYFTLDDIGGWRSHIIAMVVYFACVEIGIYWVHRTLHTNKTLYKHIHLIHHQYKTAETMTPWCSIAFHPLDGMLQACPYTLCMLLFPCHYLTHFGMLFFTAIWATFIHDSMDWNIDPIMGSKFHTVHHTHYIYNYGQVFQFCDWFWGTLKYPEGPTGVPVKRKGQ